MWPTELDHFLSMFAAVLSCVTAYYAIWPRPKLSATVALVREGQEPVILAIHNNGRRAANLVSSALHWGEERIPRYDFTWLCSLAPYNSVHTRLPKDELHSFYTYEMARQKGLRVLVDTGRGLRPIPVVSVDVERWVAS
jgi:hypothetical protein